MGKFGVVLFLWGAGLAGGVMAADWSANVEEVFPLRTVRVEHNERPRGWAIPVSPIPVVHRGVGGRETAASLFLGPGHGTALPTMEFAPFEYYSPAKLVDNPVDELEVDDPNVLKAVLGTYAHSRDRRTWVGRRLTFNRIFHFDSYIRFPMGYPLTPGNADSLEKAKLKMTNIAASINSGNGCVPAVSGLLMVTTPLELFATAPQYIDDVSLDSFDTDSLTEGVDYLRVDDETFDVTEVVRRWMSRSSLEIKPFSVILLGAENPAGTGLGSEPAGKHRKRRHAVSWLRVSDYRLDGNEWEYVCYHNAAGLRLELSFE